MENIKIKTLNMLKNKNGEVNFKSLIITALIIGTFVFAFINFGYHFAQDNSTNISIIQNSKINESFKNISTELEATSANAIESQRKGFFSDIPLFGEITIVLKSIVGVGKIFGEVIINMWKLILGLIKDTLGISPIITKVISSVIIISVVLLAWRVYRAGS